MLISSIVLQPKTKLIMKEQNKWQTFRFDIGPYSISSLAVKLALLEFGKTVLKHLHGKNTILFMFKVQTDQGFRSITHLQEFQWNKTPYPIKGVGVK